MIGRLDLKLFNQLVVLLFLESLIYFRVLRLSKRIHTFESLQASTTTQLQKMSRNVNRNQISVSILESLLGAFALLELKGSLFYLGANQVLTTAVNLSRSLLLSVLFDTPNATGQFANPEQWSK